MEIKVRRVKAMTGSLLMGGALGAWGDTPGRFAAGLVFGLGLGTALGAFTPDDE